MNENTESVTIAAPVELLKAKYEQRRIRKGKTRRDHDSGAWRRRMTNNEERAAWRNENASKSQGVTPFPTHTARGLGNSSKRFKVKPGKIVRG